MPGYGVLYHATTQLYQVQVQVFYVGRRDGLTSSCRLAAAAALSLRTVSSSNSASVVPTSHKWLACIRWRCTHERTKDKAHTQDVCMWGWQRERENEERRLGEMLSSVMLGQWVRLSEAPTNQSSQAHA